MPDEQEGGEGSGKRLGWKDYVALFIALLETIALPMVVLVGMILAALGILGLLH